MHHISTTTGALLMATYRLSVSFDPRSAERLQRLAPSDGDKATIIREGLALADLYHDITAKGGKFLMQRPDGTIAEVVFP
jgi:hypothetical protein